MFFLFLAGGGVAALLGFTICSWAMDERPVPTSSWGRRAAVIRRWTGTAAALVGLGLGLPVAGFGLIAVLAGGAVGLGWLDDSGSQEQSVAPVNITPVPQSPISSNPEDWAYECRQHLETGYFAGGNKFPHYFSPHVDLSQIENCTATVLATGHFSISEAQSNEAAEASIAATYEASHRD